MVLTLKSTAFGPGERIPDRHTCEGANLSPPLAWTGVPEGTKSFAIVCEDPDAPSGTFAHWAAYDMAADRREIAEGAGGLALAANDFGKRAYGGPCPPRGHGIHHYHFRLYALDTAKLAVSGAARVKDVIAAAKPHAIDTAELVGIFSR